LVGWRRQCSEKVTVCGVAHILVRQGVVTAGVRQDIGLGFVHGALGEFMMGADVIEVGVAGDGEDRSFRQDGDLPPQADDAHA